MVLISESVKNWNTNVTVSRDYLGNVEIKRGIYEGDTLSPLLFFIALMPHSLVLGGVKAGYHLGRRNGPVNHLLFMDDPKLYA